MGLLDSFRRRQFARMLIARLRQAGETRPIRYDPGQFSLSPGDGSVSFLANHYQACQQQEAQESVIQAFVRMWSTVGQELPERFEDLHPDLLPVVRLRSHFELLSLRGKVTGEQFADVPRQIVGEHLAVALVYDRPESMQTITQDDLARWGVTFYEALEAAQRNLAGLKYAMGGLKGGGHHVYTSLTTDAYGSSRLLRLDLIRQLEVLGDPVAMVPARDSLLVTGTDDVDGLGVMAQFAEEARQQPRPLSGSIFRLQGDEWVPWLPERDHPRYQKFRTFQIQDLANEYAQQAELLRRLHEGMFVARFTGMRNKESGEITSMCSWTRKAACGQGLNGE